jgi:D-alanine-D-alanine ligase
MSTPKVLILYNQPVLPADHPEAESERSVIDTADDLALILREARHAVTTLGLGADPAALFQTLRTEQPDVVFNLYEGTADRPETETYVAGILDWCGVPYTGSPPAALALARAKHTTKYLLQGAGLPTARFQVVHALPAPPSGIPFPVIVKPAEQDASVGIDQASVCTDESQLQKRVAQMLDAYGPPVLVEEYIPGREFNVAVIELPELQAMPPTELVVPEQQPGVWSILTYDGKWKPGSIEYEKEAPLYPKDLDARKLDELHQLAEAAYRLVGCRDYARVDFRMNPTGQLFILEVNPNPEIRPQSGFASCLRTLDVAYVDFLVRLVSHAAARR